MPAKRNRDDEEDKSDDEIFDMICDAVADPPEQQAQLSDEGNMDSQKKSTVDFLKDLRSKKDTSLRTLIDTLRNLDSESNTVELTATAGIVFQTHPDCMAKVNALVQTVRQEKAKLPTVRLLFGQFPTVIVNWKESIGHGAMIRLREFGKGRHIDGVFSVDVDEKDKTRLTVISGESGAGKTHFSLTRDSAALSLYCPVPADVRQSEEAVMTEEIKKVLATAGDIRLVATRYSRVRIVFDEAGGNPVFLRNLCRDGQKLIDDLEKLWSSETCGVEVRLVAVGTGSETVTGQPGSSPNTLRLVRLSSQADSADRFLAQLPERPKRGANELLKHFGVFKVLMQNVRIACILCNLFEDHLSNKSMLQTDVIDSAPNIVSQATIKYCKSNGLKDLTEPEDISMWCRLAVRICIENPSPELSQSAWTRLVVRYGLITDNQMRVSEELFRGHESEYQLIKTEQDEDGTAKVHVVLPVNTPRYSMSDAISLVVVSRLGLPIAVSSCSASGEPMEKTTLSKLMLLLATGCSVQVAHSHLQLDPPPGGHLNARTLQQVKHVSLPLRISRKIVDGKVSDWFPESVQTMIKDTLEPFVSKGETALIRNLAGGGPYADIIVLAKGLLWLILVKDFSSVGDIDFDAERDELLCEFHEGEPEKKKQQSQLTEELSRITEAEPRVLFFVRGKESELPKASGDANIPAEEFKRNLAQALTEKTASVISTESSLFLPPMCWPLPSQDVPIKVLQGEPLEDFVA